MKKNKGFCIRDRLFDIAWILFLVSQMVSITAWYALNDSAIKVWCYKGFAIVSCGLCLAVIVINLIKKRYQLKTFICFACFGIVCALCWWFSRDFFLIWLFALFMGGHEISSRRIITIAFIIMALSLVITVGLGMVGLAYNGVYEEIGRDRYYLGYSWTTNSATLLFFITLIYIFLRKSRMRIWEYVIFEAANYFIFLKTATKLPFFLLTAVLIFFAVQGLFRNHWKILGRLNILYLLIPVVICLGTIYVYYFLNRGSVLWQWMDQFLNGRLRFGFIGTETYGISPFGRDILWSGLSITGTTEGYLYVDCSYIKIMLESGFVFLAMTIAIYTRLIFRAEKVKDYWLVIIAIVVLGHSFSEPRLMDMTFNVVPMLAFLKLGEEPVVYKKGLLKEIFGGQE